jgi:antitoxin component YwqK of YwqJK toxin-antitoxin module
MAAGAAKYRGILDGHRIHFLKEADRPRLYGRVIDFEFHTGQKDAGKTLIEKAAKDGITPAVTHADAQVALAAKQAERLPTEANKTTGKPSAKATIKHEGHTQIIMPELPPERVHDKAEGEMEKEIGSVVVDDLAKVDFMQGPNGEPIERVKYYSDGSDKFVRYYGHFYRNKAGKNVYHGPGYTFFAKDKKKSESIYIHGAFKCGQEWDVKDKPLSPELFKSDEDHSQRVYDYYDNGGYRFHGQYIKVRYVPTKSGHTVERVPDGLHYHYFENGKIRQEEVYENDRQVGIAVYDRAGKRLSGRGQLGP